MGLWVSSLIYPTFAPFLVDVGHYHSQLFSNSGNGEDEFSSLVAKMDHGMHGTTSSFES